MEYIYDISMQHSHWSDAFPVIHDFLAPIRAKQGWRDSNRRSCLLCFLIIYAVNVTLHSNLNCVAAYHRQTSWRVFGASEPGGRVSSTDVIFRNDKTII